MIEKQTYHPVKMVQWLLVLSLSVSCLALSGYEGTAEDLHLAPAQIELVVQNQGNTSSPSVFYYTDIADVHNPLKKLREYEAHQLMARQREVKTAFDRVSGQLHSFQRPVFSLRTKTIPQCSDEDSLSSISG